MSLVELLVALATGLGVLLAASVLLVGASNAYVAQADAVDIDDGGRYALALIGGAVRPPGKASCTLRSSSWMSNCAS